MNTKLTFIIILILVVLAGAGFYIYKDFTSIDRSSTSINNNEERPEGTASISPVTEVKEDPANGKSAAAPDLSKITITSAEIEKIKKLIVINPIYYEAWLELGILLKNAGDYANAAEAWKYAAILRPTEYVPHHNLGDLYRFYVKNYPEAESHWLRSVSIQPDFLQGYTNLSDLYRYSYKEKSSEAPKILLDGLAKNPNNLFLFGYLANYYEEMGDKDNARKYYGDILKIDPKNSTALDALARLSN
ncbi:hypothetical protein HYS99_01745 [Candidatus Giovannonibacteria bacterium]|nr:hypothetical protein [Candidatus Giovannonibacteria bacterium]